MRRGLAWLDECSIPQGLHPAEHESTTVITEKSSSRLDQSLEHEDPWKHWKGRKMISEILFGARDVLHRDDSGLRLLKNLIDQPESHGREGYKPGASLGAFRLIIPSLHRSRGKDRVGSLMLVRVFLSDSNPGFRVVFADATPSRPETCGPDGRKADEGG